MRTIDLMKWQTLTLMMETRKAMILNFRQILFSKRQPPDIIGKLVFLTAQDYLRKKVISARTLLKSLVVKYIPS